MAWKAIEPELSLGQTTEDDYGWGAMTASQAIADDVGQGHGGQ